MQGCECSEGMSKSETGLRSLGQGSQKRVWNRVRQGQVHGVPKTELRFVDGWDVINKWDKY